jgi:hypothetical protein
MNILSKFKNTLLLICFLITVKKLVNCEERCIGNCCVFQIIYIDRSRNFKFYMCSRLMYLN